MSGAEAASRLSLADGRFSRLERIPWWSQERIASARVLVAGAGALGNEVIKNLALLGIGHLAVADMDTIELSNLTRSVLFRASDEGRRKATVAAAAARGIYPGIDVVALEGNLLASVGLGWVRWADVVIGALDNREARVFLNQSCARVGRPWIDGGIEALAGIVRGFNPPGTACYECTMGAADWAVIEQRRSCSMLARQALAAHGVPTTPTSASIIGGMQVQEAVKILHGMPALLGSGFVLDGQHHGSYKVEFERKADCPWHEGAAQIHELPGCGLDTPLERIMDEAERLLGGLDAIDAAREVAESLTCPRCELVEPCWRPLDALSTATVACPACGQERSPRPRHSFQRGHAYGARSLRDLGFPPFDILFARSGDTVIGLEMSADRPLPDERTGDGRRD